MQADKTEIYEHSEDIQRQLAALRSQVLEEVNTKASINELRMEFGQKVDRKEMLGTAFTC